MKLDAKVSNRDKSLLVFLIVILILFVAYYFFFQPQLDQLLLTRSEMANAQAELEGIDQEIASLATLQEKEKELLTGIGIKVAPFFYELKDDRLLNEFNTLMNQAGLKMQSYSVTPATLATIVPPIYNAQVITYPALEAAAQVNPDLQITGSEGVNGGEAPDSGEGVAENSLLSYGVNVSFIDSTYDSVISFLKALEATNKAIVVNNLTMNVQQSATAGFGGMLQGQLQLSLYSLAKPENSEKDFLSFYNSFPTGKANPFN